MDKLPAILLFIGTMLVAFQYVGDIGYAATLLSLPFALPLNPLMKKLGIRPERKSPEKISFDIDKEAPGASKNPIVRVAWWILFLLAFLLNSVVFIATQPIMLSYLFIGRPLIGFNKLLNWLYHTSVSPWDIVYLAGMRKNLRNIKQAGIKTKRKHYSDKELLKVRAEKGELPFLAFFGLICIVVGFIFQVA